MRVCKWLPCFDITHQSFRLFFCWHHVARDARSDSHLFTELSALYTGQLLPPLPLQYLDYTREETKLLNSPEFKQELAFWSEYLRDCVPVRRVLLADD